MTTYPGHGWRLARSLVQLRSEVDMRWPNRDRTSDGTIGDVAHQREGTASDHNPWIVDSRGIGVVRALDVDAGPGLLPSDLVDTVGDTVAQLAREQGAAGFTALRNGGYVISDGMYAGADTRWQWVRYRGADPHESHVHISVGRAPEQYDYLRAWFPDHRGPAGRASLNVQRPADLPAGRWVLTGRFDTPAWHPFSMAYGCSSGLLEQHGAGYVLSARFRDDGGAGHPVSYGYLAGIGLIRMS